MRIAVTGAGGQLGRELGVAAAKAGHEVCALHRAGCDITDAAAVRRALATWRPDWVVNCAAYTRVDDAETHPADAFRVNATGAEVVAVAATELGSRLCHLSTDYVFDGLAAAPPDESAPTGPLNVYGASKLAGEEAVRATARDHRIVRTSWLFGADGPNFVLTVLRRVESGERLRVVDDQVGAPTWTGHLAPALLRLMESGPPGTYHLTAAGAVSWHGFAAAILEAAGLDAGLEAITSAELAAPARRPKRSVLDNRAWRELGEAPLPGWEAGLGAYLAERGVGRAGIARLFPAP